MTDTKDAASSGLTGSVGTMIGVTLVSTGLQAALLIMTSLTVDTPGAISDKVMQDAQRTIKEGRALVEAVYRSAGLVEMMKASAQQLDLDHDHRRPDSH